MKNDLIDRYIYAVTRRMKPKIREDVKKELYGLVDTCAQVLSDRPLFYLINSYTTGFQASVLSNMLEKCVVSRHGGKIDSQELCLPVTSGGVLPAGASGRWSHG